MREALPALTSLRFFAAMLIIVHHYVPFFISDIAERPRILRFVGESFFGVTIFFVLSGFVLAYNYAESFRRPTFLKLWEFYVARFARIYPLYVLTFLLLVPLHTDGPNAPTIRKILPSQLTMTQAFIPKLHYYFAGNAPSWSVSAEAFFYLCFPAILFVMFRLRVSTPIRQLGLALTLAAAWCFYASRHIDTPIMELHWRCYINPVSRLFDFAIGICIGLLFVQLRNRSRWTLGFLTAAILEVSTLALLVTAMWKTPDFVPIAVRFGPMYTPIAAALILVFAYGRGAISRAISLRPLRILGDASFGLYLLHYPAQVYFSVYRGRVGLADVPLWKCGLIVFAVTIAMSLVLHYLFERPMRRGIRWLLILPFRRPLSEGVDDAPRRRKPYGGLGSLACGKHFWPLGLFRTVSR